MTSNVELALIKSIHEIFPGIKHFNCYFHYKHDLIKWKRKDRWYQKFNKDLDKNDNKEALDILGLLQIQYKGDI